MNNRRDEKLGVILVTACYSIFAFMSIFWSLLSDLDSVYVLAHRIVWSLLFLGIYMIFTGEIKDVAAALKDGKIFLKCLICGLLISLNWVLFIFAASSSNVLNGSLGNAIQPLFVAVIGLLVFKEKASMLEKISFYLAAIGIAYIIIRAKIFPWLALLIAITFAIYGAIKKNMDVSPQVSLFVETLCMTIPSIIYIVILEVNSSGAIGVLKSYEFLLLPISGLVTVIPMLLFNMGVKKIPYYVSGILMYVNPSLQLLIGLLFFHESMGRERMIGFIIIWTGILFMIYDKINVMRNSKQKKQIEQGVSSDLNV